MGATYETPCYPRELGERQAGNRGRVSSDYIEARKEDTQPCQENQESLLRPRL